MYIEEEERKPIIKRKVKAKEMPKYSIILPDAMKSGMPINNVKVGKRL